MIGLGLLMAAVLWLIETIKAHRQRCDACGGYAHREEIDVPGTYQSEELGERTTTTREVEHVRVDQYGITEDIRETTTTTKAVAYTKVKCIRCRYCGKVFKIYRDSGTFDRDKKDTRYYTEWH